MKFAKYFIFDVLSNIARKKGKKFVLEEKSGEEFGNSLLYAFSYRTIQNDVMMLIVELLGNGFIL